MKRLHFLGLLVLLALTLQAQIPTGYYNSANGKHGAALKTALYDIISKNVNVRTYTQIWTDFTTTDVDGNGYIIDRYTNATQYTPVTDQGSTGSAIGDGYNREHSFPKSWFNEDSPMYTDLMHLIPADCYVNTRRSNYPFGETSGNTYNNGYTKLGTSTFSGYSGTVFEPADEYKGDFARIYFYMVTRNENVVATWSSPMLAGNKYPALSTWALTMLLNWAKNDRVSQVEIDRNNAVYGIQGNRNPFVDYEGLEQHIWGDFSDQDVDFSNYTSPYDRTDATGNGGVETITNTDPTYATNLYQAVTTTAQLDAAITAGKKFIIVGSSLSDYAQQNYVMTSTLSTSYYNSVAYVPNTDNFIDVSLLSNAAIFNVAKNSNGYTLNFDGTSKYLQSTEARSVSAATSSTTPTEGTSVWTIDFSDGVATIANTTIDNGSLRFNYNSGNTPRFTTYTSNVSSILQLAQLYVQTTNGTDLPATPTFSPASGSTLTQGSTVSISTATTGATIYYSTDGGTTYTAGTSGTSTATVTLSTTGTATLTAYATQGGLNSATATATYTVVEANSTIYNLVTNASDIETGAEYLIVGYYNNNYYALGAQNGNYRTAVQVTRNDNAITIGNEAVTPLVLGSHYSGTYFFRCAANTYLNGTSAQTYLKTTSDSTATTATYTLSALTATYQDSIYNTGTSRYIRLYNGTTFRSYAKSNSSISGNGTYLFKKVTSTPVGLPTFSPDAGSTFNVGEDVTVTAVGTGAVVYYKIDNAANYTEGTAVTTVTLPAGQHTITAKSHTSSAESEASTATYYVRPTTPTIAPITGNYTSAQTVSITAAEGASIYYTTDGSTPTTASTAYTASFTVSTTTTVKAIAVQNGISSEVTTSEITISLPTVNGEEYERIYSTEDLVEGGEYLIVYRGTIISGSNSKTASVALGPKSSSNNYYREAIPVVIDDNDRIDLAQISGTQPTVLTITSITSTGRVTFKTDDATTSYLKIPSTDNNYLQTSSTEDGNNTKFSITFNDSIATIAGAAGVRTIGINLSTSPVSFRSYKAANSSSYISLDLQIFAKRASSFNISKWGWGTYYDERAYTMPEGVTGITITDGLADQEALSAGTAYAAGSIVPGKTALLLHGDGGTSGTDYDFNFYYAQDKPAQYSGTSNLLHGSMTGIAANDMASASGVSTSDYYFYKLTTKDGANVGFYWGADNGAPFQMTNGHKCWLTLLKSKGGSSRGFALDFDALTNGGDIATSEVLKLMPAKTGIVHDLQGRRVINPVKGGIYIVNGKKIILR